MCEWVMSVGAKINMLPDIVLGQLLAYYVWVCKAIVYKISLQIGDCYFRILFKASLTRQFLPSKIPGYGVDIPATAEQWSVKS